MASSSLPTFTFQNNAHLVSIKLKGPNYLGWTTQFIPALKSNDLLGIVDGSKPYPPKVVVNAEGKETPNPEFIVWNKKDQYLLSWLNSTLSEKVLPTVYGLDTAKQV
jgi:hypothetical protein